jgi:hypothetical protein
MLLFSAPRIRRTGLYLCIGLLFALLIGTVAATHPAMTLYDVQTCRYCDARDYVRIAQGYRINGPLGWRILAPTIVRLIPLPFSVSFSVATFLWLWMDCMLLYAILRRYQFGVGWSVFGVLMLHTLYWFIPFLVEEPYLVDSLAMGFILLAIYAALCRRPTLFLFALTFGVLAKESVLFTAPLWFTLGCERDRVRKAVLLALPAVLVLLVLRIAIPGTGYNYAELPGIIIPLRIAAAEPITEYVPFGVLPLLALGSPRLREIAQRYAPYVALVYLQVLFAGDTGRLLVIAFPPVVLLAVDGTRRIAGAIRAASRRQGALAEYTQRMRRGTGADRPDTRRRG